jgi:hypothetical protein
VTNTKRQREERLTEALRSNLARRKAQARERLASDFPGKERDNELQVEVEMPTAMPLDHIT